MVGEVPEVVEVIRVVGADGSYCARMRHKMKRIV